MVKDQAKKELLIKEIEYLNQYICDMYSNELNQIMNNISTQINTHMNNYIIGRVYNDVRTLFVQYINELKKYKLLDHLEIDRKTVLILYRNLYYRLLTDRNRPLMNVMLFPKIKKDKITHNKSKGYNIL